MFVLFYTGEKGVISVCAVLHFCPDDNESMQ